MTQVTIPKQGSKIGMSSSIGTNFAILSNAATSDPTGEQAKVQSSSADDTEAGNGIQQVRIRYFDTNWVLNDELVTLNGTSSVNTVATDILRIESFENSNAGLFSSAAGTVTLKSMDGTKTFAQIDPQSTAYTKAFHTVSPGHIGSMLDISVNCTSSSGITFVIFKQVDNTSVGGGIVSIPDMIFSVTLGSTVLSMAVPLVCDAVQSSVGLGMGVAVKGLAASQVGSASFHYLES